MAAVTVLQSNNGGVKLLLDDYEEQRTVSFNGRNSLTVERFFPWKIFTARPQRHKHKTTIISKLTSNKRLCRPVARIKSTMNN
jgi:hypothetical protein